MRKPHLNF